MHAIAIVTVLAAMLNPLPAKSLDNYHVKFAQQFEKPVVVAEYKFND